VDRRAPGCAPEADLGRQGDRASRAVGALRAGCDAAAASTRRRRADLSARRLERGRIGSRGHRQSELPAERVRPYRDDPTRRNGPGCRLGSHRTDLRGTAMMIMKQARGLTVTLSLLLLATIPVVPAAAAPAGQMTWAVHISLAPTW